MTAQELILQVFETSSDTISCPTSFTKTSARHSERDPQTQSQNLDSEEGVVQSARPRSFSLTQEPILLKHETLKNLGKSKSSVEYDICNAISDKLNKSDEESQNEINSNEDSRLYRPQFSIKKHHRNEEHLHSGSIDTEKGLKALSGDILSTRLSDAPGNFIPRSSSIASLTMYKDPQVVEPEIQEPVLCSEEPICDGDSNNKEQVDLDNTQCLTETSTKLTSNENKIYHSTNQHCASNEDPPRQYKPRSNSCSQRSFDKEAPPLPQRVSHDSLQLAVPSSTPDIRSQSQRKEMYYIKKIKWCDAKSKGITKVSPILTQNANGPCPLLGLVNALTLSTPAGLKAPLVETLKSREQVSLGLLLDAVFDEITSGRHGNLTDELPDVTDLYSFLVSLHTGMNVNPNFFPKDSGCSSKQSISGKESRNKRSMAGLFEETREVRLYSTFRVPLIHGWLPQPDSSMYAALLRSARTYEDAQNILLMQESLETKLSDEGLNLEEQILLEDISAVRAFFDSYATQLSPFGIESIRNSLSPGDFAILFRNNHFSTLYRHPKTLQLLQLVTDIGYAKNNEVVWESLIDVTGEYTQFYSGDFRLVSDVSSDPVFSQQSCSSSRVTRQTSQPLTHVTSTDIQPQLSQSQIIEQEDHDLAMAIQLQEEEEQRHKATLNARRRANNIPHQQDIRANQSSRQVGADTDRSPCANNSRVRAENRPIIPPRRGVMNIRSQQNSQVVNLGAEADQPPPSYEVAATQKAYVPPEVSNINNHSSSYNLNSVPRPNQNLEITGANRRSERREQIRDQIPSSGSELRSERRPGPVQGVVDKMIAGQGRVQKECAIM
ncbi:putative duf544 domain-containing protein [Erysiphe neolycopersici]|uniref:Putative duf544 domain-containing protein n=1 Tax=Erysiphe neolycopersici TaxID=212602 RepID=A0A420HXJ6_9PEZI|nr:putative duf544 domain-containing protein [Erysiphe neolycopersici]